MSKNDVPSNKVRVLQYTIEMLYMVQKTPSSSVDYIISKISVQFLDEVGQQNDALLANFQTNLWRLGIFLRVLLRETLIKWLLPSSSQFASSCEIKISAGSRTTYQRMEKKSNDQRALVARYCQIKIFSVWRSFIFGSTIPGESKRLAV